jgi:hypothetical protein
MVKGFMKPQVFELPLAKDKFRVELERGTFKNWRMPL